MKKISILGSTGSIGVQTLDVIGRHPERYEVTALAAGGNIELLLEQALRFRPRLVSVREASHAERLQRELPAGTEIAWGDEGLLAAASHPDADYVVTAIVGSVGLGPTLAAIEAGKTIGLANKETLVTAGHLVTRAAREHNVELLPIDSEHSAIFQCLGGERRQDVHRLILTASGGSFRDRTREELAEVTVEQALRHPNWSMGAKITIDSATLANKGFELIEAHWLFDIDYDRIDVLLHPQSIIHSMVEFIDGSVIAQLGTPDMRVPIQYALSYPERHESPAACINLAEAGQLDFAPLDMERFPMLRLAYEAGRAGGTAAAVLNAANETAVSRFLRGEIAFLRIDEIVQTAMDKHHNVSDPDLHEIMEADRWARELAGKL